MIKSFNNTVKFRFMFVVTVLFLLVTGFFYKSTALSFPFVDEQYNFAIGKYLTKGEILYDDIITNHQPITHILSALVQEVKNPNTTFSLLVAHRVAVAIWSGIWALVIVTYFGIGGFLFVVLYELTKSYMFGNLFLAESIVVYPLLFIVGVVLYRKTLNKLTLIILGISLTLTFFTLGPIWPALAFLGSLLIFQLKNYSKQKLLYLFLAILAVAFLVGKYSSFTGYIYNYLFLNFVYTIPAYHASYYREPWIATILKAFASPLFSFIRTDVTSILWIIRLLSIMLIINIIYLIQRGKLRWALMLVVLLGLSNIRFVSPGVGSYGGFHLLPWYSVLIFVSLLVSTEQFKQNVGRLFKIITIVIITASFLAGLSYAKEALFVKSDLQKEYTTNYSTHTDIGQIINIMKNPEDTLFVSPDAWLVYWQSDTHHPPKLFGYYAWTSGIPEFHKKIHELFNKNPPTFFYCEDCKGLDLGQFLTQYKEIKKNGGSTHLFVLPSRIENQTNLQSERLKFYGID
ncbi:hypothetical protein A2867_01120 [Candidatus Daviesbacteria bacterium RIFCSPHIGHO2_01_FULL_40_11]|uniref:Glycosyltransferase RgtA/B/C/D-like domain-containing protein n=1 Tax=Candidatus Daviesbacteria bacterium RIFCSPHIGHO2_01_FULL_40_11 TaxID=1797762 RepID=A0A1F5JHJ8_9BACT|nr:MAG: hypothetical protein A2867_01120 [Candidatus Daviesbacteria bacterium RIFCSPHIGHO2_01_FULL_40_11]OGE63097.1 MAG: hypothetical protein A2964_03265 [Candidatus Daviesbacteria bacterium RIFCSPLOWO2_01_FULL_40_27]